MKDRNSLFTALLFPVSALYGAGVFLRNLCFDTGIFHSREFPLPVISVGNITVGGTGKTPHVEYIISLLKDEFSIAVLSRGYKRKSRGFVLASTSSGTEEVGDEPLQIKKKFPKVEVALSANRVRGISKLLGYNSGIQVIILDDAFQHRWVKPGISVLLVDYNRPVGRDSLLPAGRLRENISSTRRASIVVVTKCPADLSPIDRRIFKNELKLLPWQSLFFTGFSYNNPVPVFPEADTDPGWKYFKTRKSSLHILMVTGIATPDVYYRHLQEFSENIEQLSYPDHHNFTPKDIKLIEKRFNAIDSVQKTILTTEKDAMRFQNIGGIDPVIKSNMYYVPVSIRFMEKTENKFKKQILNYVRFNKRDHFIS
jgi:tetraacyldisaccharide 4'-kinase